MPTRYDAYPDHPLCGVPQEILDAAREVMAGAAEWKDVDPEMVEPLADAVVAALRPWLPVGGTPVHAPGCGQNHWPLTCQEARDRANASS